MTPSLKSRPNRFLILILIFVIVAFSFQAIVSNILYKQKPKIENYLNSAFGYRITFKRISFNLLKGLHIKGISIFYNAEDKTAVFVKNALISVKIPSIFLGKVVLEIKADETQLLVKKEEEGYNLQIIFSDIYKKISEHKSRLSNIFAKNVSIFVGLAKFIHADNPRLANNMHILLRHSQIEQRGEKFKFNSDIEFKYPLQGASYMSRFIKDKGMEEAIKCAIQGTIKNKDLHMDLISVNIKGEQILGMGINKGFAERNPYIDIIFIPSTISLNNIAFLSGSFKPVGHIFISLKINGLLDSVKTMMSAILDDCSFGYTLEEGQALSIKDLRGDLEYKDNQIKFNNGYLELNDLPLNFILKTDVSDKPRIDLKVSVPKEFLYSQQLPLDKLEVIFNGKLKKTLMGNLEISALYKRKAMHLDMKAYFKNIDFDYANLKEKYFRADSLELIKSNVNKVQRLNFTDLKTKLIVNKNKIEIGELKFCGYNGALNGRLDLDMIGKTSLVFMLNGAGLDVKALMQDINISNKLLSGNMDIKIAFDNRVEEFLKGRCYIKDGTTDLDVLLGILKFPSLKGVNFDIMHTYFSISKNIIKVRGVKLLSPDVMLNAYWDTNNRINGVLNMKMSSEFLKTSTQFRKLLNLTRIKKPYIDFGFSLGGLPDVVRFRWRKDEFKDKLDSALPAGIKKSIQANLDKTLEDLSQF